MEEDTEYLKLPVGDIGPQLNGALISELSDKNWKVRNEALQKVSNILAEARFITGNLGELPPVLAQRLVDSRPKIAAAAITICQNLATAMGGACKQHTRTFFPGLLHCMGVSKSWIKTSAVTCINTFGEQGGFQEFFEGEMIAHGLKSNSPALRAELWKWLAERLPLLKTVPKDKLVSCLPYLYSNLEDRNADVRKNAQEAIFGIMIHVSYDGMLKATSPLKPGSQNVVVKHLDKVRANLPAKPAPAKSRAIQPSQSDDQLASKGPKIVKSRNSKNLQNISSGTKTITKSKAGTAAKPVSRQKDEDVVPILTTRVPQEVHDEQPEPEEEEEEAVENQAPVLENKPRPVSGPFGLDMDFIERIETEKPRSNETKLIKVDLTGIIEGSDNVKDSLSPLVSRVNASRENQSRVMNALNMHNLPKLSPSPDVLKDSNLGRLQKQQQPRDPDKDSLDRSLSYIVGSDIDKFKKALSLVRYLIRSKKVQLVVPRVDNLMSCCLSQLRTVALCNTVYSKEELNMVVNALFCFLHSFYNQPILTRQFSLSDLKESIHVMVRMVAEKRFDELSDRDNFVRNAKDLVKFLIKNADSARVTCALLKLLHESVEKGEQWPAKMQELFICGIGKVVKYFPSWEPDVDYDPIMLEIHSFLKSYPTHMWKHSQSKAPLRTVKFLLLEMVKQRGSRVLYHMSCIDVPEESELPMYVNEFIKKEKSSSQQRLSKDATRVALAGIFKKIHSKDHMQEAFRLLYEFKEQHSESSIEPFLQKSHPCFRHYIRTGLEWIELERRRQAGHTEASSRPGPETAPSISSANTTAMDNASSISESGDVQDAYCYTEILEGMLQVVGVGDVADAVTRLLRNELHLDLEAELGIHQNLNINSTPENSTELSSAAPLR